MYLVDLHEDIYDYITFYDWLGLDKGDFNEDLEKRSADIPKYKRADLSLLFAVVCPINPNNNFKYMDFIGVLESIDRVRNFLESYGFKEFDGKLDENLKYILSIEGLGFLNEIEKAKELIEFGVKNFGIMWEQDNQFGNKNGLKEEGYKLLDILRKEKVIIDLAHAPDKMILDVLDYWNRPIIISHTGLKSFKNFDRNISDEVLRKVADNGGVVGIMFDCEYSACTLKELVKMYNHLKNFGDIYAIGTDFFGIPWKDLGEIKRIDQLELLFKELKNRGWGEEEIEKLKYGNAFRIIKENL